MGVAVKYGNETVLDLLIDAGADIFVKDKQGRTVSEIALQEGTKEICDIITAAEAMQRDQVGRGRVDLEMEDI